MPEWSALDSVRGCMDREKPAGSFTVREYAARYRLPRRTAGEQLERMADGGTLETKKIVLSGCVVRVYWMPKRRERKVK